MGGRESRKAASGCLVDSLCKCLLFYIYRWGFKARVGRYLWCTVVQENVEGKFWKNNGIEYVGLTFARRRLYSRWRVDFGIGVAFNTRSFPGCNPTVIHEGGSYEIQKHKSYDVC